MNCRAWVAIPTTAGQVLVALSCLAIGAWSVVADVTDSFSRPPTSSTTAGLGTTESGDVRYVEVTNSGTETADGLVAHILDGRMAITGVRGDTGRVFLEGYDSPDVKISFRAEFENDKTDLIYEGDAADRPRNTLGVMLRARQHARFGNGSAGDADTGYVAVEFLNNGGLLVRQRMTGGRLSYVTPNNVNATAGRGRYRYAQGTLGEARNAQPFDRDNDGVLEAGERFDFAVILAGHTIVVRVNGLPLFTGTIESDRGPKANGVALFKGRPGKFSVASSLLIDDLHVSDALPSDVPAPIEPQAVTFTPGVELIAYRMIWDRGRHQAFTDLIRYNDLWVCSFREAPAHDGGVRDSKIRVLTSEDSERWTDTGALADPRGDIRDSKLSITPDGELMLLTAIQLFNTGEERRHQSVAYFTRDLQRWDGPHDVLDDGCWLWGLTWHNGVGYSIGYRSLKYTANLYTTRDGRRFERLVESIDAHTHKPNESSIVFDSDTAYCLLRAFGPAYIGVAKKPFTQWTWTRIDQPVGGPEMLQLPDGRLLGGGRLYLPNGVRTTSLLWIDPRAGTIQEALRLPSGGDTSYPGMVWHEGKVYMSYYSSHAGKSSIYFAEVAVEQMTD